MKEISREIPITDQVLLSFLRDNTPRCGNYESTDKFWDTWITLAIMDGIMQQHNPGFYKPIISLTPQGIQRAKEIALIHNL